MKRTSLTLLLLAAVGASALAAGAAPSRVTRLRADLTLRPGVSRAGHPAVHPAAVYGALDGRYNDATSTFTYTLDYKGLQGTPFRVVIRSRTTGATYAVLCSPCSPVAAGRSGDGLPVSKIAGSVTVDPDTGFLIAHGRTFVEIDTTAYPAGEIGGRIHKPLHTGGITETPRCC
jgi:CHRD domain-containing protein